MNAMIFTRRKLMKAGLAAIPLAKLNSLAAFAQPDSNFHGVQIGIIVSPYNFPSIPVPADQFLNSLVKLGISAVEIQDVRCEVYAGAPSAPREGYSGSPSESGAHRLTAQERAEAERKQGEMLTQWRLSSTAAILDKYKTLRKLYHDAGVRIYAFRLANMTMDMSDAEYNYFFEAAKAVGADQITVELPEDPAMSKRMGDLAEKHKIMMGYHNHTQVNANSWDVALGQSKYNGIQLDIGHFAAAINGSPIPFIEEHHDRITNLHLKDRKFRIHGGANLPWGQGETQVKEVLQLMRDRHYKFPAGIELEYKIPADSTPEAEISKCLQFCRDAVA
jgi:sugar phosphate isomerase/epimerase